MSTTEFTAPGFTALVMAASRRGATDPVAQIQHLSHKCLVTVNGKPMVQRVIETLRATRHIKRIYVSIEDGNILRRVPALAAMMDRGEITIIPSQGSIADSVYDAVQHMDHPFPLVISTADNVLHTPEMIDHFCAEIAQGKADGYVGMTRAQTILDKYPNGQRAFHRLKDDAYSSCNLYCLANPAAVKAASAFATGGQFGKKPERIIAAFGYLSFILYKLRLISLDGVMGRISKALNTRIRAVIIPWAEGPIDVDGPKDYDLATEILRTREAA